MPFTFDFIKVKSYKGLNSVGSVQITGGDLAALEGKNVLVVEDIIDTGGQSSYLRGGGTIDCGDAVDAGVDARGVSVVIAFGPWALAPSQALEG